MAEQVLDKNQAAKQLQAEKKPALENKAGRFSSPEVDPSDELDEEDDEEEDSFDMPAGDDVDASGNKRQMAKQIGQQQREAKKQAEQKPTDKKAENYQPFDQVPEEEWSNLANQSEPEGFGQEDGNEESEGGSENESSNEVGSEEGVAEGNNGAEGQKIEGQDEGVQKIEGGEMVPENSNNKDQQGAEVNRQQQAARLQKESEDPKEQEKKEESGDADDMVSRLQKELLKRLGTDTTLRITSMTAISTFFYLETYAGEVAAIDAYLWLVGWFFVKFTNIGGMGEKLKPSTKVFVIACFALLVGSLFMVIHFMLIIFAISFVATILYFQTGAFIWDTIRGLFTKG